MLLVLLLLLLILFDVVTPPDLSTPDAPTLVEGKRSDDEMDETIADADLTDIISLALAAQLLPPPPNLMASDEWVMCEPRAEENVSDDEPPSAPRVNKNERPMLASSVFTMS